MEQQQIDFLQQQWLVQHATGRCLHIGSGMKPITNAVNLDPDPERWPWANVAATAVQLPFADETFDTVVSSHVLPIFADIRQALREMARVLVLGGRMAHVIPDLRYAPSRASSRYPFEHQFSGWYGPDDFQKAIVGVQDMLIITHLRSFMMFNWSFQMEAIKCVNSL